MLNLFKKFLIITILGTALSAQCDIYIGSNYSLLDFQSSDAIFTNIGNTDFSDGELGVTSVGLVWGMSIVENLSAEIRSAGGMFGSNVDYNDESDTTTINVDLKYHYGAYLKYNILNKGDLSPYAVLGYTQSKVVNSRVDSNELKGSDISYGIGVDFALNDSSLINFEYMNYIDSGNVSINGFSFGIKELF